MLCMEQCIGEMHGEPQRDNMMNYWEMDSTSSYSTAQDSAYPDTVKTIHRNLQHLKPFLAFFGHYLTIT